MAKIRVFISTISLIYAPFLMAALGQNEQSVAADQRRLEAQRRVTTLQGYSVHEITRQDGSVVTEYVSSAGTVFGVSWRSPALPNLSDLLGDYFSQFQTQAAAARPHSRRALVIRTPDFVVESAGHMRDFRGRAFVRSLIPSNLSEAVIQ